MRPISILFILILLIFPIIVSADNVILYDSNIAGGEIDGKLYYPFQASLAWANKANWYQVPYSKTEYVFKGDPIIYNGNFWMPRDETTEPIKNIIPGSCTLQLSLSGYQPVTDTITIVGGQITDKTYNLIPVSSTPTPTLVPTIPIPSTDPFSELLTYISQLLSSLFVTGAP